MKVKRVKQHKLDREFSEFWLAIEVISEKKQALGGKIRCRGFGNSNDGKILWHCALFAIIGHLDREEC